MLPSTSFPTVAYCFGLSVACERDDARESLLLREAGDGQASMEETAEAMRSRQMSARRYGDFIVGMATSAVLAIVKTCENAAALVIVRRDARVLVNVSSERSARCAV